MEEMQEHRYGEQERLRKDPTQPTPNSVYLQVCSEQAKGLVGAKYAVPNGFVGVVEQKGGASRVLFPGEEATGDFTVHLLRDREIRIPFHAVKGQSRDGFDATLGLELSVTPDIASRSGIDTFLKRNVEGRAHLDWPLLKGEIQPFVHKAVVEALKDFDASEIVNGEKHAALRESIVERCAEDLARQGVVRPEIQLTQTRSEGLDKHRQEVQAAERQQEKARAEQQVQAAMLRDQLGAELSRQELEEFLASAREEGLIKEQERKRAELERKNELDRLHAEYTRQKHSLEATLRQLFTERQLEIDALKLDSHVDFVRKLREELDEDRLEVYINLIRDEKLKAELLAKLIHRSMTPEQLKAVAEIEVARARQVELAVSRPSLEPVREAPAREAFEKPPAESEKVAVAPLREEARRTPELEEDHAAPVAEAGEASGQALTHEPEKEQPSQADAEYLDSMHLSEYVDSMYLSEIPEEAFSLDEPAEKTAPPVQKQQVEPPKIEAPVEVRPAQAGAETDCLALVAAGRHVFAVDPLRQRSLDNAALEVSFEDGRLGSLRSVRAFGEGRDRVLLAGARNGVYSVLLAHARAPREFPIGPQVNARTGINAAVLYRGFIYATHSEFGLLRWPYLQPYSYATQVMPELTSQFSTTRALTTFNNNLLFANGPAVLLLEAATSSGNSLRVVARYAGTRHEVTALAGDEKYVLVADAAGEVHVWDPASSAAPVSAFHAGTAISDLASAELKDGRKALLAALKRPIMPMLFQDGGTALEFAAPEPVRACSVHGNTVIGLSRDRARIFAWTLDRPDWPRWQFQFTEPVLDARLVAPGSVASG